MELELVRAYFPGGTNGELYYKGQRICFTIERPWLQNKRQVSCIPEGRYRLKARFTVARGWHLQVCGVPGRAAILVHAANDALKELEGCIAPVSVLQSAGRGLRSRVALEKLEALVFPALSDETAVFLTIKQTEDEPT